MTEIKKTSAECMLGGKKVIIQKLKAGKYYQAQQIYVGMIDKLRNFTEGNDVKGAKKEKVSVSVTNLYSIVPQEVAKLVAFCIDVDEEKLLEEAYPEELAEISEQVIELNNFNENLKNSVAPMGNLGAVGN